MISLQAEKIAAYQDKLTAAGVDPDVLKVSLPVITDIVTLRHFENTINQSIAARGAMSSKQSEQIQEMYSLNQRLNGELNRVLADFEAGTEADKEFFDMIRYFTAETKASMDRLGKDIDSMEKQAVGHYFNLINGNVDALINPTSPIGIDDTQSFKSYPEALTALNNKKLIDNSALPDDDFRSVIDETTSIANSQIRLKADELLSQVGTEDEARAVFRAQNSVDVDANVTSPGLFSMHLETKYAADRAAAQRPYEYMKSDKVEYYSGGTKLDGQPVVDVRDVFGSFFEVPIPGVGPLSRITKTDITAADRKVIDDVMVSLTDGFFMSLAEQRGVPKSEILKDLGSQAEDAGVVFEKGRNKQAVIAEYMVRAAQERDVYLPFFEMNPSQLRQLDMAVRDLRFKYRMEGETSTKLKNIETLVNDKFNQFQVDGVPVENLGILDETRNIVSFKTYLDNANANYTVFKQNWHDTQEGAVIAELMSWGKRQKVPVTGDNPSGIRYNKPVSEFLTIDDLTDEVKSNRLMLSVSRALGVPVGNLGYRLVENASDTVTAQGYIRAIVGRHLNKSIKEGTATADEMRRLIESIENNITMVDDNGVTKPLISVIDVFNDTVGSLEKSVPKEILDVANENAERAIKNAVSRAVDPARKRKEAMQDAYDVIRSMESTQISANQIGTFLLDGGRSRYNRIKDALSTLRNDNGTLKYSAKEVDEIIADSYLLNVRTKLFKPTGRRILKVVRENGEEKQVLVDELAEDVGALTEMLGGNEEQKALVRDIVGQERYDVMEATAGFLAELQNNPLANTGLVSKGIPRSLSVESYISRLYAINRGVVRPQYVGTEALLQLQRTKNFEFLMSVITDKDLGGMFLEMVRTGKPLDPARNNMFQELLVQTYAMQIQMHGTEKKTVVDPTGRKFTIHATPVQKERMGYDPRFKGEMYLPSLDVLNR